MILREAGIRTVECDVCRSKPPSVFTNETAVEQYMSKNKWSQITAHTGDGKHICAVCVIKIIQAAGVVVVTEPAVTKPAKPRKSTAKSKKTPKGGDTADDPTDGGTGDDSGGNDDMGDDNDG